jgi:hypothetical protein
VEQIYQAQSKTKKQHAALGRQSFKIAESIFTHAGGQHHRLGLPDYHVVIIVVLF